MKPVTTNYINPWILHAFLVLGVLRFKLPGDDLIASFERKHEVIEYKYLPHFLHHQLATEMLRLRDMNSGRATFTFWAKQFGWANQAQTPNSKEQRLKQVLDALSRLRILNHVSLPNRGRGPLGVMFEPKYYKKNTEKCYEFFNVVQQRVGELEGRWRILQDTYPGCEEPVKAIEWRNQTEYSKLAVKG